MVYLFFLLFFVIYYVMPMPIQIILLLIDGFAFDPIPIIDELLMIVMVTDRIRKVVWVHDFIIRHRFLTVLIIIALLIVLFLCGKWILSII